MQLSKCVLFMIKKTIPLKRVEWCGVIFTIWTFEWQVYFDFLSLYCPFYQLSFDAPYPIPKINIQ